jgi:hypothetical protein
MASIETQAFTSPDGKFAVEVAPNHSGLLFWSARGRHYAIEDRTITDVLLAQH